MPNFADTGTTTKTNLANGPRSVHLIVESNSERKSSFRTKAMKRTLSKLNPKRCCKHLSHFKHYLNRNPHSTTHELDTSSSDGSADSLGATNKNKRPTTSGSGTNKQGSSVNTLDLFRYANFGERVAASVGLLLMLYAASWQPISVFVLATMAALMGQYSKRTNWLRQASCNANLSAIIQSEGWQTLSITSPASGSGSGFTPTPTPTRSNYPDGPQHLTTFDQLLGHENINTTSAQSGWCWEQAQSSSLSLWSTLIDGIISSPTSTTINTNITTLDGQQQGFSMPILRPIYSLFEPLFWASNVKADSDNIRSAIGDLLELESRHFLRSSFEINGSAFLLAQTQLVSFFLGISLISWVARQQAARIKILYFRSCIHQELTWFESIDNAAGSGSSLNTLVGKYEDGIGVKLALLSYFIGHIVIFACVGFYELANLALFCMPFVLLVWLVIVYLSNLQSVAIGDQSMFAKRSLQLAEEIIATVRTVFAFNGQHREVARFNSSLEPVYEKSLTKHLYTALNTSLSKFSIFACFSAYCFYARRMFPPFSDETPSNRSAVLAVMRGAEVSIVNILISIPFMEALQQSKGCIARIHQIIERKSRINPSLNGLESGQLEDESNFRWDGSVRFEQVEFCYAQRPQIAMFRRKSNALVGLKSSQLATSTKASKKLAETSQTKQREASKLESEADLFKAGQVGTPRIVRSLSDADRQTLLGTRQLVLTGLTLDIEAGQSVALVGPSGSGKSTVVSLVQRLYDITGGRLLIGSRDIRTLSPAWLRNQIGVVTQEPRLFDLTIRENIELGLSRNQWLKWDKATIEQQVIEAARLAGAHNFIKRLPLGYETCVGSGGVQLSGGQKQRIAIARALIRRPKLLLLDECTSALDSESESLVMETLRVASVGTTTLTVAHRLATIKGADLIVVMDHGRAIERGSHEQLMQANGLYRRLYEEQSSQLQTQTQTQSRSSTNSSANSADGSSDDKSTLDVDDDDDDSSGSSLAELATILSATNPTSASELDQHPILADHRPPFKGYAGAAAAKSSNGVFSIALSEPIATKFDAVSLQEPSEPIERLGKLQPKGSEPQVSGWKLWKFAEIPRWSTLAAVLVCLVAGLILPLNLIAHSYLFSAFAYQTDQQLGNSINVFGLMILSFSALVFIISFLQIILPGYVGERISKRMRSKILESLLNKPIFYFDIQSNGPGALCDRFNSHISNIQSIAGTQVATLIEASSTLLVSAVFGFTQSAKLSIFCLGFAIFVLFTTMIESRLMQLESSRDRLYDTRIANLMADALSNIKTIASLNGETFFTRRFSEIIRERQIR